MLGWALGAGREGVWQALGVCGRAGGHCRQLGARAQGAAGARQVQRATGGARGRLGERQAERAAGGAAAKSHPKISLAALII